VSIVWPQAHHFAPYVQMTRSNILTLLISTVVLSISISVWRAVDPHRSDYAGLYASARLWKDGRNPYDQKSSCEVQRRANVSLCLPSNHPPILFPLIAALANENYVTSYFRWSLISLLVVVCCAWPLYYIAEDAIKTFALLCFYPIFVAVRQGQDTSFVLLGVLICFLFLLKGKDRWAGVALGLTMLRPQLALALGLPLAFSRPKAFRSFCLIGVALALYSLILVGLDGFKDILNVILVTATGADESIHQAGMYNLVAILVRLRISSAWAWPFFGVAIAGVSFLWRKTGVTTTTFGLAILLALFFSPHLHTHDLSLLVMPLVVCSSVIVALLSLAFVVASVYGVQQFLIFALMASLAVYLVKQPSV
jgi:Glycosyltransferase family 87